MSLLDSNIIIDASKAGEKVLRELITAGSFSASAISYLEVLGYHRLTEDDRADLEAFFSAITAWPISDEVVRRAVKLRQVRKMSLGDALVAGTALVHQRTLVTRNTKDFDRVDGLILIDPTKES